MKKSILIFLLLLCSPFYVNGLTTGNFDDDKTTYLTNPLTDKTSKNGVASIIPIDTMIGKAINTSLGIVGSLALAMFIYGGFLWLTSGGNSEQVQKGKCV